VPRLVEILLAGIASLATLPFLALGALAIVIEDRRSPIYVAMRVGRLGRRFRMYKVRTMRVDADAVKLYSTADGDARLLVAGRWIRRFKLDELPQFWNILAGDMSFVGPRPNVPAEVAMYTTEEQHLLDVRPGVTDFASIVFSDLSQILAGAPDPNREYNRLVRPWKSRLGLHYVRNRGLGVDLILVGLTAVSVLSRRTALAGVSRILRATGAASDLVAVAQRKSPIVAVPPPGASLDDWEAAIAYRD
jgi:lipopolysaccharide/colanic/teichoic acid biosynthesis glycosyltransferase